MTDVEIIKQKRPDVEIFVYKDAGHGFHCDERGSFPQGQPRRGVEADHGFLRQAHEEVSATR
jgi:hypothetical protein